MATYKYLSDQCADGTILGTSATDKISLYGVTPIVQRANATQAAVAVTVITTAIHTLTTGSYGFASTVQATDLCATVANLVTLVNELRLAAIAIGMIKGSA